MNISQYTSVMKSVNNIRDGRHSNDTSIKCPQIWRVVAEKNWTSYADFSQCLDKTALMRTDTTSTWSNQSQPYRNRIEQE